MFKDARKKRNIKVKYIAKILGVSRQQYYNYENRTTPIPVDKLFTLIDLLQLDPLEVYNSYRKEN